MSGIVKLSAKEAKKEAQLLKTAAACIRRVTAERDALIEELRKMSNDKRVAELKTKMAAKGLFPWGPPEANEEELQKIAAEGRLEKFAEAVELASDLSRAKLGELSEAPNGGPSKSAQSKAELDAFVLG